MVINGRTVHNLKLTEEERVLLEKNSRVSRGFPWSQTTYAPIITIRIMIQETVRVPADTVCGTVF